MGKKILIVGAGFFGAVCAHELTAAGWSCHVIEQRSHLGGNCYTNFNTSANCHQHVYGPHIFHTKSKKTWNYIRQFTDFNHFVLRPRVVAGGCIYAFPINLFTLYQIYGVKTPAEAAIKLDSVKEPVDNPQNLEEWCLSQVGRQLYETFVKGYTAKQWGCDPRLLPVSIIQRLPIRLNFDDNYFNDPWQGIPVGGYTAVFEKLLANIPVDLKTDFMAERDYFLTHYDHVIYTGSIDRFFNYEYGVLAYRSLRFETELHDLMDFQGTAMINYTDENVPFTRIVEHKHFDMNYSAPQTLITREYPCRWQQGMLEFYPINTARNQQILQQYQVQAARLKLPVTFGGRLGSYQYYNMDQVIAAALQLVETLTFSSIRPS